MAIQLPKIILIIIALMLSSVSRGESKNSEFIFLNAEQLRCLGVDLSERGFFYLNCSGIGRARMCRYISLRDSIWSTSEQTLQQAERVFRSRKKTRNNAHLDLITTPQGCLLVGREDIRRNRIPIAVSLSEANLSAYEDTIILWFVADRRIRALYEGIVWRDYQRIPHIDTTCVCRRQPKKSEFIFLNAEQLRYLGFELSEKGLFYLNCHRFSRRRHHCLYIRLEDSVWHHSWHTLEGAKNRFRDREKTSHNFFPQAVTTSQGCPLVGREDLNTRHVPVAISLSEANLSAYEDTVVFWFPRRNSLLKALPEETIWQNYERVPVIDTTCRIPRSRPEFPGGEEARIRFISENAQFPNEARKRGIHGLVRVAFVVEPDGSITNIRPLTNLGGGLEEEAVRVVSMMPKLTPAKVRGRPVRVQISMPIGFRLTDDTPQRRDNPMIRTL